MHKFHQRVLRVLAAKELLPPQFSRWPEYRDVRHCGLVALHAAALSFAHSANVIPPTVLVVIASFEMVKVLVRVISPNCHAARVPG
jgi:hypothetical protein